MGAWGQGEEEICVGARKKMSVDQAAEEHCVWERGKKQIEWGHGGKGKKKFVWGARGEKKIDCGPGGGRKSCVAEGEETN